MAEKKKVLGKGKFKSKENSQIKKLELPKHSNEFLPMEDLSYKKFKASKLSGFQSNSEVSKRIYSSSPSHMMKRRLFHKKTSETPKFHKEEFESKRKSMPNIKDISDMNDSYIKNLSSKVFKFKTRNSELEEEIKLLETRFKHEEFNLKEEIFRLNSEIKHLKSEYSEKELMMHREMLEIRRDHEETKMSYKFFIHQINDIVEKEDEKSLKKSLEDIISEVFSKFEGNTREVKIDLPSNCTASFQNIANDLQSSREILRAPSTQAIALHDYFPVSQGELEIKKGDRITVLNFDDTNGWWLGKINEKIGLFPRNCVMLD